MLRDGGDLVAVEDFPCEAECGGGSCDGGSCDGGSCARVGCHLRERAAAARAIGTRTSVGSPRYPQCPVPHRRY